jgi:hypothetical protein
LRRHEQAERHVCEAGKALATDQPGARDDIARERDAEDREYREDDIRQKCTPRNRC